MYSRPKDCNCMAIHTSDSIPHGTMCLNLRLGSPVPPSFNAPPPGRFQFLICAQLPPFFRKGLFLEKDPRIFVPPCMRWHPYGNPSIGMKALFHKMTCVQLSHRFVPCRTLVEFGPLPVFPHLHPTVLLVSHPHCALLSKYSFQFLSPCNPRLTTLFMVPDAS